MLLRLAGVLFISVGLYAQSPDISAAAPAVPSAAQAGPNFNAEAATRAYLDTLGTERKAHSDSYFEGGYWLILWDFLYGVAISLILLATKLSAKMRDRAEKITKHPPLIIFLYWVQYLIAASILGAPLAIYEGFLREKQYQLMNQTFSAWVVDQLKELAVDRKSTRLNSSHT